MRRIAEVRSGKMPTTAGACSGALVPARADGSRSVRSGHQDVVDESASEQKLLPKYPFDDESVAFIQAAGGFISCEYSKRDLPRASAGSLLDRRLEESEAYPPPVPSRSDGQSHKFKYVTM